MALGPLRSGPCTGAQLTSSSFARYMNLEKDLTGICGAAGLDGPVVCPYDWRQTVEFSAEAWVAPRIRQHVGDKKKARRVRVKS